MLIRWQIVHRLLNHMLVRSGGNDPWFILPKGYSLSWCCIVSKLLSVWAIGQCPFLFVNNHFFITHDLIRHLLNWQINHKNINILLNPIKEKAKSQKIMFMKFQTKLYTVNTTQCNVLDMKAYSQMLLPELAQTMEQ